MFEARLKLVTVETAAQAAERFALGDEARKKLDGEVGVREFLHRLSQVRLWPDAITTLAYVLPKREAIWWGCRCVRIAAGPPPTLIAADALLATERWVTEPSEDYRRAAEAMAKRAGLGTPAGLVAMSAFWSGGSLAPVGLHEVPPGEFFTARGIAGAILMAGVLAEPEHASDRYHKYLDLGLAIADGLERPPSPAPVTRSAPVQEVPRKRSTRIADTWE